ncbi:MAG: hypothetical protein ACYC6G_03040 [Desulfobaccales bacterium]
MAKLAGRKEKSLSTIVHLKQKKDRDETQPIGGEKDYKKLLEDKIKEKLFNLERDTKELKGGSKEQLQKKRRWMSDAMKPILEVKDTLERTELIEIKLIYRRGNVALNDLKNIIIKSKDYDESKLVKSGFRLDIDFCPKSQALNNKKDCYLVQLLGNAIEQENLKKYYSLDTLMEFVINYCSEYIAEFSTK